MINLEMDVHLCLMTLENSLLDLGTSVWSSTAQAGKIVKFHFKSVCNYDFTMSFGISAVNLCVTFDHFPFLPLLVCRSKSVSVTLDVLTTCLRLKRTCSTLEYGA